MRLLDLSENELDGVLLAPTLAVASLGRLACTCKALHRATVTDGQQTTHCLLHSGTASKATNPCDTTSPLFAEADCGPRLQQPRSGKPRTPPRSSKTARTQRERRRHGGEERAGAGVCALCCNRGFAGKPRGASGGAKTELKPSGLLPRVVEDGPTLQRAARRVCRTCEAPPQVPARTAHMLRSITCHRRCCPNPSPR